MNRREIALAYIRREVQDTGELTPFALRKALEHRISNTAMMAAAREGLRRRKLAAERPASTPHPQPADDSAPSPSSQPPSS
jgi:hypothetical protein